MKNLFITILLIIFPNLLFSQKIDFIEYNLDNGMHVILHRDASVPLVVTSVMYHVGAKDEDPERTGFAHFFEHLLFEGTKNIPKGEFMKIVERNGGSLNANTSNDRTYYYEFFPSNKLELGLWLESERLMHPVIDQIGVETQNEVVKEEKRLRVDNSPYGHLFEQILQSLFKKHPYRWTTIGSMDHLDAATLEEFQEFNKKFYVPNNAVLVCYRTPSMKSRDAYVLDMISTILSDGKSSRLYKKMVDEKKISLQVQAVNLGLEDYGGYVILSLPLGENSLDDLLVNIEEEVVKLQNELISDREYSKLQNIFENNFVSSNASMAGVANSLARYYMLYGNTNLINDQIDIYKSITKEEIRDVARKYLKKNQRAIIDYLPKKDEGQ